MPPRRKGAKAAKAKAKEPAKDQSQTVSTARGARKRVRLPELPLELWRMIIKEACSYPFEMDYSEESPRAMAALGCHDLRTFNRIGGLDARRLAYQTRRNVVLVNKLWWALGQEYFYHTIFISESSRPLFPDLLCQFLRRPSICHYVRRLELNFEISRVSVESTGTLLRGFIKNCPNLEVVDDHVTRKTSSKKERGASPIRIAPQAAHEIPFAIALGNKHKKSIKHVGFSAGSTAAFTFVWSINAINRFENLQILSLHEFPGWQKLPPPMSPEEAQQRQERARRRLEQGRSRYHYSDEEEEDEDDEDDPDAFSIPNPIRLPCLHTLDISRLPNTEKSMARSLVHWLKSWEIPAVKQLGLSVYHLESIPFPLLYQVAPTLKLLVLHHFSVKHRTPPNPPGGGSARAQRASTQAPARIDPLQGKVIEFPELERIIVTAPTVNPNWYRLFDCPKLSTYFKRSRLSDSPVDRFGKMRSHITAAYNHMPRLVTFQVLDVPFKSMEIPDDKIRFWRTVNRDLVARKIRLVGAESTLWKDCRPADEEQQLRKRKLEAEKAAAEKAAAEKAEAERLAAEKAEAERLAAEKAAAEKAAASEADVQSALAEGAGEVGASQGDSGLPDSESQRTVVYIPEGQEPYTAPNRDTETDTTSNANGD
ncbi:SubName: Full=Uncharacterized protein {ECO:0000313/EMBL:CCA70989.1} [Serendipita indica DSM 11827]|nr:SubName: Full=Uncharacterized protein {ECO:0000313/EMBL:CCA70989.1} [Serendipita indica DSM 11827]